MRLLVMFGNKMNVLLLRGGGEFKLKGQQQCFSFTSQTTTLSFFLSALCGPNVNPELLVNQCSLCNVPRSAADAFISACCVAGADANCCQQQEGFYVAKGMD